jgi:hypothetical protein
MSPARSASATPDFVRRAINTPRGGLFPASFPYPLRSGDQESELFVDARPGWYITSVTFTIELEREEDGRWIAEDRRARILSGRK